MLFSEEWWLRAATGDKYEFIKAIGKGASASLPIFRTRKLGLKVLAPPPYTRIFEPTIICTSSCRAAQLVKASALLKDCLVKLSGFKRVEFVLRPEPDLCLSFISAGFSVEDAFTFLSAGPANTEELWSKTHPTKRNNIRVAKRSLSIMKHSNIERYITISSAERLGNDKNDYEVLRRLWSAVVANDAGIILSAVDQNGCDAAVAVVVWDKATLYFLLTARSPRQRSAGDNALLVWSAIEMAERNGLVFDLDGYHSTSALRFNSQFGLVPVARKRVFRSSISWKFAELGRDILRTIVPAGRAFPSSLEGSEERPSIGAPIAATNPATADDGE